MARNTDYSRSDQDTGDSEKRRTGHSSPPFSKRSKTGDDPAGKRRSAGKDSGVPP